MATTAVDEEMLLEQFELGVIDDEELLPPNQSNQKEKSFFPLLQLIKSLISAIGQRKNVGTVFVFEKMIWNV